jgi:hypothetical protein
MLRILAVVFVCTFALPAAAQESTSAGAPYNPAPWLADLAQIKRTLAEQAPNLEWSIAERGLDPAELARQTEDGLYAAKSEADAREVLRDFLNYLGDGHVTLEWPDEKEPEGAPGGTASICRSLGFVDEERPAGLPFDQVGGRLVATPNSALFPIYVLDLPGGKLGVLRLSSFYEWGYFRFCPQAVAEIGLPEDGECAEDCGAAIGRKASDLLTQALAAQIEALRREAISALAVDLTQNGGGSLWLDPVARMLTPIKLKTSDLTLTRTPVWREALKANLQSVEQDLASATVDAGTRAVLIKARGTLGDALAEASIACDRMTIWDGGRPSCSLMVPTRLHSTGVLDYAEPGAFARLRSASALFYSSLYDYEEGVWQGPLYVIIDEGVASAGEHFAALLKDNDAATLIGEPTFGAGCGWMAVGDRPTKLLQTGGELHVPDCIWYRKDGSNEVAGVEPDIIIPWRFYDNGVQKARRAMTVLHSLRFDPSGKPAPSPPVAAAGGSKEPPALPRSPAQ